MAQPTAAQGEAIRAACRSDYMANCRSIPTGGAAALACLQEHAAQVSPGCRQALQAVAAKPAATAPIAAAAPASAAATTAPARAAQSVNNPQASSVRPGDTWPHTVTADGGNALVFQPQIISWPQRQTLNTRMALAVTPEATKTPVLGTIEVAFATDTDLATRTVALTDPKLLSSRFPALDTAQAEKFEQRIKATLAGIGVKRISLDTVLLSLGQETDKPKAVALQNDPPQIFVSARPASLVVFDGDPIWAPITGTPLSFAVNTNWDVFAKPSSNTYYLLNNGSWLTTADLKGSWKPAGKLPPEFTSLPNDANFAAVKKQLSGRPVAVSSAPTIFVATTPAAIIVTNGAPQYVGIPGTSLSYVANSDAALFRDASTNNLYYLQAGRWFSAATLAGPWAFATASLPADFARIPANSPRGFVLASIPGTVQAQQALIEAQIPQQATLSRATAKLTVVYAGEPRFEPIVGTPMLYARNTSFDVIKVGDVYFAVWQGAWFTAPTPTGPWALATTVPAVIFTIPPSSPMYHVTYVKIYNVTPEAVTFGYTTGYTMSYVSAGVVVYGTGYYYPPYYYPAPIPIYYPYPYTYSGATYYNSATGAWAHGGAIYGPYGGEVKGGTAYNPNTGAWAHGGAVYGPNGGAGAFSAYNPSTGGYAHGSAVWGPDGASGNADWYNPRTGVTGSTNQNSNQYGRWGSSTFAGPNQTVNTQSQSNAQGSAGSFKSSSGAEGAGVHGVGGNNAGVVKTSGGDVYAGADGNVYKKTDSGWEKYDNGSWNSVQKPDGQKSSAGQTTAPGLSQANAARANAGAAQQNTAQSGAQRANSTGTQQPAAQRAASNSAAGERSQNLSGATERGSAFRSEGAPAPSGQFGQLENDRQARTMGAQRQQQYGATRSGGFGGGYAGRAGASGGRYR